MTDPVYKPTYDASHAQLIGIDDYEYPEFAPLGSAERDTRELGTVLAASPYKFEVTRLLGKEATRFAIFDALHRLEDGTGADDRVLIYFAGHGDTLNDRFDREVGYLSAVDTVPDRHHTALKMADVME
ncbi:MAG: caspase family protein, partial [Anaerolineae bacterium]